jgi:hypothetical protein
VAEEQANRFDHLASMQVVHFNWDGAQAQFKLRTRKFGEEFINVHRDGPPRPQLRNGKGITEHSVALRHCIA